MTMSTCGWMPITHNHCWPKYTQTEIHRYTNVSQISDIKGQMRAISSYVTRQPYWKNESKPFKITIQERRSTHRKTIKCISFIFRVEERNFIYITLGLVNLNFNKNTKKVWLFRYLLQFIQIKFTNFKSNVTYVLITIIVHSFSENAGNYKICIFFVCDALHIGHLDTLMTTYKYNLLYI